MTSVSVKGRRDDRMPRNWSQYASVSMDEGSYESGLNNFESIRCPGYVPSEIYIQQFVYLSLVPTTSTDGERKKGRARRERPRRYQKRDELEKGDEVVVFDEKMARRSLTLLTRLLEMQAGTVFEEDSQRDHLEFLVNALPSYRRTTSTAQSLNDTMLDKGAAQINKCRCIWDVLRMKNEDAAVDQDAWGFFDFVVRVWETQARIKGTPTHLVANLRDAKYDVSSALDAVLAGFDVPTKLSPLSCSPSVGIKVRQEQELFDAKIASESLQRVDISKRLLSLILQLVQKGAINISALKTHLGSQLSLKESKIVCDVMNAFPVECTDIMLEVMVSVIQASGEKVDQRQTPILQILQSAQNTEFKAIGLRNVIVGKSPSVNSIRSRKQELEASNGNILKLLLSLL